MEETFSSVLMFLNKDSVPVDNYISILIYTPFKLTLDTSELPQLGWEVMIGQGMLEQLWS